MTSTWVEGTMRGGLIDLVAGGVGFVSISHVGVDMVQFLVSSNGY